MSEIYDRQSGLGLQIPDVVTVVGVGGVGSWISLDLALTGVYKLYLYDDDVIEQSNLNRTPFKISQVGMLKVTAMAELIAERRPDAFVIPVKKKVKKVSELDTSNIIIDCRDTKPFKGALVAGGYDGNSVTLHFKPNPKNVWGDDGRAEYTITPSWLIPPQLIASLITTIVCYKDKFRTLVENEKVITFNMLELVNMITKLGGETNEAKKVEN